MLDELNYINRLIISKNELIKDSIAFLRRRYPSRTSNYNKCIRDLNYVYNAIVADLQQNSSMHTKNVGNKFWYDGKRQIREFTAEFGTYDFLNSKMKAIYNTPYLDDLFLFLKNIIRFGLFETPNDSLTEATLVSQHCQRNWDYNHFVPDDDIATLIEVATTAPTKQNLSYYKLIASTDRSFNNYCFKNSIDPGNSDTFTRNTQVDAPLLLLWCYDPQAGDDNNELFVPDQSVSINYDKSIMISLGATALAAAQLGYRTGFCQCVVRESINQKLKETFNKDLVFSGTFLGIGKPNPRAKNWYEVLDSRNKISRIVYPEIRKEIEIYKI